MFDDRKRALVRALIYPIQFDKDPVESVSRIFDLFESEQLPHASIDEYAEAIHSALDSEQELAKLIPQDQQEDAIRSYLAQLQMAFKSAAVTQSG